MILKFVTYVYNLSHLFRITESHTSDPQTNNVRLECSAPLSNECLMLRETRLLPLVFSRADLYVREDFSAFIKVYKRFFLNYFFQNVAWK